MSLAHDRGDAAPPSTSSRPPFVPDGDAILIPDGRDTFGMPKVWRWDPDRLDPRTRAKLQKRHADPPLHVPSVRDELTERLRSCEDDIAELSAGRPASPWPFARGEDRLAIVRQRDTLLAELYGRDFARYPRQVVHKIAAPLDPTTFITLALGERERVPPAFIVGGALVIGMNLLLPGHMLLSVIVGCVLTALLVGGSAAARWWADKDPLQFTDGDRVAIDAAFKLISVPISAEATPEYALAKRAVAACDRISRSQAFSSSYLEDHQALLDADSELIDMVCHAHQLLFIRESLGREPVGDDVDSRLAREAFHQHDRTIAGSLDYLRRRVGLVETYADHLADLDRQLDNLEAVRRAGDVTPAVDALFRYDALADLSADAMNQSISHLDVFGERIRAQLDVLRGDLDGLDRLIAVSVDDDGEDRDD